VPWSACRISCTEVMSWRECAVVIVHLSRG